MTAEHLEASVSPTSADTMTEVAARVGTLLDDDLRLSVPLWSDPESVTDPDGPDERRAEAVAEAILAAPPPDPPPDERPSDGVDHRDGVPLPPTLRAWAERGSGRDLGGVRLHRSRAAEEAAKQLAARAFTRGTDIVLGPGVGDIASGPGLHTLAHEIGHVVAPPVGGRVGRDPGDRWDLDVPTTDVTELIKQVPGVLEELKGINWDARAKSFWTDDAIKKGAPQNVLYPEGVILITENYVVAVTPKGLVADIQERDKDRFGVGDTPAMALVDYSTGHVWAVGTLTRADGTTTMQLISTNRRDPSPDARPGQSVFVVQLPGVTLSKEVVASMKARSKGQAGNASEAPGWSKDQLAQLKKDKARKAGVPPKDDARPGGHGGADETGEGKGNGEGTGKGSGATGEGTGSGKETQPPAPPLKGPVQYFVQVSPGGDPELVIGIDRAFTKIRMKDSDSAGDLEARADKALQDLQDSRDPSKSTKLVNGAKTTGFVTGKDDTPGGTSQTGAQADAQAKSTSTAATPGERTPGAKGGANAAKYPSRMTMAGKQPDAPALSVSGATNSFTMELDYAAESRGFSDEVFNRLQNISYYWEIIDVTHLTREKAELTQKQAEKVAPETELGKGKEQTAGHAVTTNLKRDMNAIAEDEQNDLKMMSEENWSWDARAEYLLVIGLSNIVRTLGSIIGSFIDAVTQPLNARSIGFDDDGDYIIRCVATPQVSDEAKADPEHHVIRASSVAVMPIRIQQINKRAEGGLEVEQQNLDARQAALDAAKKSGDADRIKTAEAALAAAKRASTLGGFDTLQAQVADLKDAIRVGNSLKAHRAAKIPDKDWPDDEVTLSIRLIKDRQTLDDFITSRTNMLEGLDKDGANVKFATEQKGNFVPIGGAVVDGVRNGAVTEVRPRLVLASEETGQVTDILCMLGQTSPEGAVPTQWRLVDITTEGTHDYYRGSSPLGGKEGREAAIRDCFRNFAENANYGRGTLAIRLPAELMAAVGPVDVDREMRSAPGRTGRFLQRLKDIGKVAMVAGLFATGGLGIAIGVAGGVSGAIVAIEDLVRRARTGHITDSPIEVVLDGLTVIAGLASVAQVGTYYARGAANDLAKLGEAPPTWLKGLERTEGLLKLHANFSIGQQIITIPYQFAMEWSAAEKEPDEGKRNSMKMRAILHALESGAMTAAMLSGPEEEEATTPTPKEGLPLPKGTGADEAHAHADNAGPAKPPTRDVPVHDDGTTKPTDTSTPPQPPPKKSVEDQLAQARKAANEALGKTNRAVAKGEDETIVPEEPATTPKGTPDPTPPPRTPVKETNGAARDEAVELLKARVGTDRQLTPRTDGKPPAVGTYGEPTSSASAAVALYDKAVSVAGGREVGLYFNPETGQFSVEIGTEHEVHPPAKEGWQAVVHLHPNPENVTTLRLPAPADIKASIKAAQDSPAGTHIEYVQSVMHDGSSGMTKVTVTAGPPVKVTVEMAASGGHPPRTIVADSALAYAKEYDSETTYLGEGTDAYAWAMKDLHDFYEGRDSGGQTAKGTAKPDKAAAKPTDDPPAKPTDPAARPPADKSVDPAADKPVDPAAKPDPTAVPKPPAATAAVDPAVLAARHKELEAQRPKDLRKPPRDARGNLTWTGTLEAEYQGRPAAEEGYHWLLRDGKLQYVREEPEEGQPERPKLKWNETTKALEADTGAPEVRRWAGSPKTSKATAFDDLGGSDPTSAFGRWVKLMEGLGFKRSELIESLQDPTGLTHDTVRGNLKNQPKFGDAIRRWLGERSLLMERYPEVYRNVKADDPAAMAAADRIASQRAMLDLEKVLPLKDATNWTERWYIERYGREVTDPTTQTVTKVETQVRFDKDAASKAGIDLGETRVGDAVVHTETTVKPGEPAVESNTLQEIKGHSGELSPDDKAQWNDYKKLIGKDVPRTETQPPDPQNPDAPPKPVTTHIDGARQVFLDPLGGKANADFIAGELAVTPAPRIEFRVFNTRGVPKDFGPGHFVKAGSKARLAAEIVAYCDS